MRTLVPWRFGAAFALTAVAGYTVRTVIWLLFAELSVAFVNASFMAWTFAGYVGGTSALSGWIFALAVPLAWALLIGALFARAHNSLTSERLSR